MARVIAIDFDETLFATLECVIEIYNKRYNGTLSFEQIRTYNLYECLPADIADKLIELFSDEEVYSNLQPYKGSIKAIQTLVNRGFEVYIATATSSANLAWKERLIERYFPFIPKDNIIRIHNKKLLRADFLIEDKLDNLVEAYAERICFDQIWNRDERKDFVYSINRIYHWCEVVNVISNLERRNREWENE